MRLLRRQGRRADTDGWTISPQGWRVRVGTCIELTQANRLVGIVVPYLGRRGTSSLIHVEVDNPSFQTFAVDAFGRLYWSRAAIEKWTIQEIGGVLVHEIWHVLRNHIKRGHALLGPNPSKTQAERFNVAADLEINDDHRDWAGGQQVQVVRNVWLPGLKLPDGALVPSKYGLPDGQRMEFYYYALKQEGEGGSGDPGDPLAGDVQAGKWELGDPVETGTPGWTWEQLEQLQQQVANEVQAHGKTAGNLPGSWQSWADLTLTPSQVPWRQTLAKLVRVAMSQRMGMIHQSYQKLSKKTQTYLRPGWQGSQVQVAAVVDTSGSMSDDDIRTVLSEVMGLVKGSGTPVALIGCAVEAASVGYVSNVEALLRMRAPSGGTDMRVGIDLALRGRRKADVIVVLTDGDTPWPISPIGPPMIVVLTEDSALNQVPAWAHPVVLK